MSKQKHTPEPWKVTPHPYGTGICRNNGRVLGSAYSRADAERIVACVNAMEGIDDPADMRRQLDEARRQAAAYMAQANDALRQRDEQLKAVELRDSMIEQFCTDLNQAHDEVMRRQGCEDPHNYDWPEWTPQANSIRWAERVLGKRFAKLDCASIYCDATDCKGPNDA
jgi:hypothetical protein